jgi:hypothetical protein
MKRFLQISSFLLLVSCSKEKIPTALEDMTILDTKGYEIFTSVGDNSCITEDGFFIINSVQNGLVRFDLNSYSYGSDFSVFNPPHNEFWKGGGSMLYHNDLIYYVREDSIFVYEPGTDSLNKPDRIIRIGAGETIRMIDVEGDKLYATDDYKNIYIADLTGIDSVKYDTTVFVASFNSSVATSNYQLILDYHNGYLFLESDRGIDIADVSDPTNTTIVATIGGGSMAEFRIDGNFLYLVGSQVHGDNLQVYDITNPADPNLLIALPYIGQEMLIIHERNELLVQQAEKIRVFDISDPKTIKKKAIYSINGLFYNNLLGDMEVRGNLLYLVSGVEVSSGIVAFSFPSE